MNEAANELPPDAEPSSAEPSEHQGFQFLHCETQSGLLQVWQAVDAEGRHKWVKIVSGLARRHTLSAEDLKRVAHLQFIKHPRLLPYERIENDQGRLLIVMPWPVFSLKARYQECLAAGTTGVPREELLIYLQAAAEGLTFLDRQESLHHLALGPQHLVVVDGEVRLADYGLVQLAWMPAGQPLDLASLRYAAPELFENEYSRSSDQFSLAMLYCEMLTGKLPFSGTLAKQMREQRLANQPDLRLLSHNDAQVLAKALQKDPGRRFDSLKEFLQALEDAQPRGMDSALRRRMQAGAANYTDSAAHSGAASAVEVERTVNQLVQLAAYSTVLKDQGGMRYQVDEERCEVVHRCAAWLPPGMAWQKLEGFAHQWQAYLAFASEDQLTYQIELPQNFWRRFVRASSDFLEITIRLISPRSTESKLTEVLITVRYPGQQRDEGRAAIQKLGPTLIYSVRTYLLATTEHRMQERFDFDYPLWVYPSFAGQVGEGMSCHGKNISRHGIGFLAPYRLPTKDVQLQVITSELGALSVPATVLRTQALNDGQYEVGARFKMPALAAIHPL